jgi:virginiamycin A acetyltransferase
VQVISHPSSLEDVVYTKAPSRPLLKIGALSYAVNLYIFDYQSGGHNDREDGIVEVGRGCSLGTNIHIHIYGAHDYLAVSTSPLMPLVNYKDFIPLLPKEDVQIGNDVWIGNDARILSGVKIGDGAVIGAMTVVAKDIPPYAVVVGNPARIIKYRFSESQIKSLLKIRWWDWPHQKINENAKLFFSHDIDKFIETHENKTLLGT